MAKTKAKDTARALDAVMGPPDGAAATEIRDLPPSRIAASPTAAQRVRRAGYGADAAAELLASVRAHGVLQPLLVRVVARETDGVLRPVETRVMGSGPGAEFELVAGERRLEAAKAAGLATVPCVVAFGMSDARALEAQMVENIQREGLAPLAEAEGVAALAGAGLSAAMIAERLGRSKSHVLARLKLRRLCDEGREALAGGLLDAATAVLVARIPRDRDQIAAVRRLTRENWNGDLPSHREAKAIVAREWMRSVAVVPWDRGRAGMAVGLDWDGGLAPACVDCQHRAGNDRESYPDSDPWLCARPDCHDAKTALAVRENEDELRAEGRATVPAADVYANDAWRCNEEWVELGARVDRVGGEVLLRDVVPAEHVRTVVRRTPSGHVEVNEVVRDKHALSAVSDAGGGVVSDLGRRGDVPGPRNPDAARKKRNVNDRARRKAVYLAYRAARWPIATRRTFAPPDAPAGCVLVPADVLRRAAAEMLERDGPLGLGVWAHVCDDEDDRLAELVPDDRLGILLDDCLAAASGALSDWAPEEARAMEARAAEHGVDVKRVKREAVKRRR